MLLSRSATISTPTIKADTTSGYTPEYDDDNGHAQAEPYDEAAYPILPLVDAPAEASSRSARSLAWSCSVPQGLSCSAVGPPPSPAGEPPLIAASNEPIKVAPQNPGGVEIPNQNKQIYERARAARPRLSAIPSSLWT